MSTSDSASDSSAQQGKPIRDPGSDKPSGVKLLLICHGEGMQHRYADLGNVNSGLTARGWEEVEALANWLSTHETLRALYSGPLLQSRLTAQRIGQASGLSVSTLRNLPRSQEGNEESGAQPAPVNGEPLDGDKRTNGIEGGLLQISPLDTILSEHPVGTIALVASPENIRQVLRMFLAASDAPMDIDHTSISALQQKEGRWSLAYINRREHVPAPVLAPAAEKEQQVDVAEQEEDIGSVLSVYDRVAAEDVAAKASDDRERINDLLKFANLPDGLEVLDAGTGLGVLALMLAEEGAESVIGVDISPGMLEQAEYLRLSQPTETTNRVSYRLSRLESLPFADERFDAVSCRLVLNHFRSPERIVREFVRVLKPNGIFIMAELLSVDDPVKRATQNAIEERRNPSHVAARSAEQYDKMVTEAGLEIVDTASANIDRNLREWLEAYRTPTAVASTVIEMVEAGLETDAAGIEARKRGDRIEFVQRMYYLKAIKPAG